MWWCQGWFIRKSINRRYKQSIKNKAVITLSSINSRINTIIKKIKRLQNKLINKNQTPPTKPNSSSSNSPSTSQKAQSQNSQISNVFIVIELLFRQEQSNTLIKTSLEEIDQSLFNNNIKKTYVGGNVQQAKILELVLTAITITAQYFSQVEGERKKGQNSNDIQVSQSGNNESKLNGNLLSSYKKKQTSSINIYSHAYKIAVKYLTQYHKLTQTLFVIYKKKCRQQGAQEVQLIRKKKSKIKRRLRYSLGSNRTVNTKSDKNYLNVSLQPDYIVQNEQYDNKNPSLLISSSLKVPFRKKSQTESRRMKTLDSTGATPYDSTRIQQKQKYLNKLYGNPLKLDLLTVNQNQGGKIHKHLQKKVKYSSTFKYSAYIAKPQHAQEMKQLETISKLYLPKLEEIKRKQKNKQKVGCQNQKKNAMQIIKNQGKLERLKPKYFQKIAEQPLKINPPIKQNPIQKQDQKFQLNLDMKQIKLQQSSNNISPVKEQKKIDISKEQHQKVSQIKPVQKQTKRKEQGGCQLI